MSTSYIDRTTAVIGRIEGLELVPHAARLLANGEPVELEQLAAASGWPLETVKAALDERTSASATTKADWRGSA